MSARIGHNAQKRAYKHFVREWRKRRGLTLAQLADRVATFLNMDGFDHSQLSKIERHTTSLTEDKLYAVADSLNIEPGLIFVHPDIAIKRDKLAKLADSRTADQVDSLVAAFDAFRQVG